jgi:hypothetical protein
MCVISTLFFDCLKSKVEKRFGQDIIDAFNKIDFFMNIVAPLFENVTLLISVVIIMNSFRDSLH